MYWGIIEYRLVIETNAVEDQFKEVVKSFKNINLKAEKHIDSYSDYNQLMLRDIIIEEFTKSYHRKDVDNDNDEGNFKIYKRLILRLVDMISEAQHLFINIPKLWLVIL